MPPGPTHAARAWPCHHSAPLAPPGRHFWRRRAAATARPCRVPLRPAGRGAAGPVTRGQFGADAPHDRTAQHARERAHT
eukprot:5465459-Prymnesium_polylepis.1